MKKTLFFAAFLLPTVALALTIEPADLYSDVRSSNPEAAGINMLSREGIIKGYGARRFLPNRQINRAEFLKIAMIASGESLDAVGRNCFPDVRTADWFSAYVCAAKDRNIVKGINDGLFHPEYTVTYGEALKMLSLLFEYEVTLVNAAHWAEPYYRAAAAKEVDLPIRIDLDTPLTRGLSARLAAAFLAESKGQLPELRLAEGGRYDAGSSSSMSSSRSSSSSNSSTSSSSRPADTRTDTDIRSQFLLLGEVGPILGAGKIFIQEEPIFVTQILVSLTVENPTVQSLLVYDDDRRLLGRATLDPSASTNRTYKLILASDAFRVAQRDERRIYVRADTRSYSSGGQSNQTTQISSIVIKANGEWSNNPYTVATAVTESFPQFLTARSMFTSIMNAGGATAPLLAGSSRTLGSFTFSGRKTDASAHLDVTDLTFDVGQTGGVTVSSVTLGTEGFPDRFSCTVTGTQVICTSIPDLYGSVTDGPRTLTLYGTVGITDPQHASLRLTLNNAGSPTSPGAMSWSDGTSNFDWVPLGTSPLADGTYYSY